MSYEAARSSLGPLYCAILAFAVRILFAELFSIWVPAILSNFRLAFAVASTPTKVPCLRPTVRSLVAERFWTAFAATQTSWVAPTVIVLFAAFTVHHELPDTVLLSFPVIVTVLSVSTARV